jgi:hypothetical protein
VSVPLAIAEAARAAALPARAISEAAAITAGVEVALAADRRCWGRRLLARLDDLPVTATNRHELLAALAEEFYAAADAIDHGRGRTVGQPCLTAAPARSAWIGKGSAPATRSCGSTKPPSSSRQATYPIVGTPEVP